MHLFMVIELKRVPFKCTSGILHHQPGIRSDNLSVLGVFACLSRTFCCITFPLQINSSDSFQFPGV